MYSRKPYYIRQRPPYETFTLDDIINVKDHGAKGHGVGDDTAAINSVMGMASTSKLIYFPAGSYIVTGTIHVPSHALITGEVWLQIVASGSFFQDMKSPKPMVKVGNDGDQGTVEISDMLFTSTGSLPGLVLMEWNVAAEEQGSVAMFDAHFRVGGAYGSKLTLADCPKVTSIPSACVAASMLFHVTPKANGYFENNTMVTVGVARGFLIESKDGPTWLYGTASEHSMLYQYNFYNTGNLFAGMIQTESPYFQYTDATSSPGPFKDSLGVFSNDPDFSETCNGSKLQCDFSWAAMSSQVSNVTIAGAGLYSWFDAYDQSVCVDAQNCQQRLIFDQGGNGELWVFNLVTIGSVEMISDDSGAIETAKENTQANAHPFWSALAVWGDESDPVVLLCDEEDTDPGCLHNDACDLSKDFADMDALVAAQGSIPPECAPYYVVNALSNLLEGSLGAYDSANKGYDAVWEYYAEGFRGSVDAMIRKFTADSTPSNRKGGPGIHYFDCTITLDGTDTTKQCPFDFYELAFYQAFDMKYTLRDADGFYKDLNKTFGIATDWVAFYDLDNSSNQCIGGGGGGDPGNGPSPLRRRHVDNHQEGQDEEAAGQEDQNSSSPPSSSSSSSKLQKRCGRTGARFYGIPKGKDSYAVPNPKDAINKVMPQMLDLQIQLAARQAQMAIGDFNGSASDVGQALSLPVFMMAESIEQIKEAKEAGQKIKNQKDLEFFEKILGVIFMFLPFLDTLSPELLLFEGMATGLAFLGNTALAIQDIVEHPENAFMDVLGIVMDGAFSKTGKGYKTAADARRGMSSDLIKKSGKTIEQLDGKLQDVLGKACAK
ncbi:LysM domain-containing protein [Metarhizium guizhouense ARSEF 977]|uniref:LysM domain-containing protein n=1 Tax=Metarhizium guizhouense (strain ARSEF 977) TaxID=1276136 RepID=A0A0B4GJR6_METGA|nr:LysM domain-containing protein [Metarhizium guizhouense ARSEF 977]